MSVLQDFKSATIWIRLTLLLLFIATVLSAVAFCSTGWGENGLGTHWGLWRRCGNQDVGAPGCVPLDGWANDWWAFTQAAAIFGFFGILTAFGLTILHIFVEKCRRKSEIVTITAVICFISGTLYLLGCIVFGVFWDRFYVDETVLGQTVSYWLSYAYGLSIVASLLEAAAGVFLVVEVKGLKTTSPET